MSPLVSRRGLVTGAAIGAGTLLSGCDRVIKVPAVHKLIFSGEDIQRTLQRAVMGRDALAHEYSASEMSPIFRSNGTANPNTPAYNALAADRFAEYRLRVDGLVARPLAISLAELRRLPARTQITRHDCVEGWSAIGQWTGVPLREILDLVEPKPEARYVVFHCFDRYATDYTTEAPDPGQNPEDSPPFYGSIGLDEAVHPQTILAYGMNGNDLPVEHGAPLRLRVERQLGYKNTKYIKSIELVKSFADMGDGKGGYWEDQGYQWNGGI